MIACYHTQIDRNWATDELHQKLSLLPHFLQDNVIRKHQHLDIQLSVTGNLLLLKLIDDFGVELKLNDLRYGQYQRPYFEGGFDFNISHSGNCVICCATVHGKLGVDIELMKPVAINLADYFTETEQQNIRAAQNQQTEFFKYWTRKEAVLKTIGTGVYTPLLDIDVSVDEVGYQGQLFHLLPIEINAHFAAHIAFSEMQNLVIKKVKV